MNSVLKWLYGLASAAIGAAGSGITVSVIDPATFNFTPAGLGKLGTLCGVNALIAVGLYLKQSPLPAVQTTTQTTSLETKTVVTPAPAPPAQ